MLGNALQCSEVTGSAFWSERRGPRNPSPDQQLAALPSNQTALSSNREQLRSKWLAPLEARQGCSVAV